MTNGYIISYNIYMMRQNIILKESELRDIINESVMDVLNESFVELESPTSESGDKNFDKLANKFYMYVTKLGYGSMYDNQMYHRGRYMLREALKLMERAIKEKWSNVSTNPNKNKKWGW